jgi:shikimate dehydrogenase
VTVSAKRKKACIVGWPVKHSRSPKLHGYWIEKYGLDAAYEMQEVRPADFPEFLSSLRDHGYVGCNVTIPHKEAAYVGTVPDEKAQAVGAANTVWYDAGRLRSTNTDIEGFTGALDATAAGWERQADRAVVLGAGGAARAIIHGLLDRGIKEIHVANRTVERAEEVSDLFGSRVRPAVWASVPELLSGCRLLVNTTSLGMHGQPVLEIDLSGMADGAIVSDAVYVPLQTPLLRAAEARGFKTANGLDMLLYQAVRGFHQWFGVRPEVTAEQRAMLVRDIEARG